MADFSSTQENDLPESAQHESGLPPVLTPSAPEAAIVDRLPFSFAKKNGVVLNNENQKVEAVFKEGLSKQAFAEVNRLNPRPSLIYPS